MTERKHLTGTDNGDGSMTDTYTGLQWMKNADGCNGYAKWDVANTCVPSGWRLPTIEELYTLCREDEKTTGLDAMLNTDHLAARLQNECGTWYSKCRRYEGRITTMQMILEARVDRLENIFAEMIERQMERDRRDEEQDRKEKEAQEAFRQEMRAMEVRFEEWLKKDKEERKEERKAFERQVNKAIGDSSNKFG
ncbi:MAG: DUF1566 domain-containing protein, partial [Nitrospirae bacterium]|nr:DUF1566 domain-containing protein [Nitrospirota bacterium]